MHARGWIACEFHVTIELIYSLRRVVDHARWGFFRKEMLSLVGVVLWVAEAMGLLEGFMLVVAVAPNPPVCNVEGPHSQPKS
jgi:hypothetical protein